MTSEIPLSPGAVHPAAGSAGRPTRHRSRDSELTKTRLLDAAERLFAERGFSATSMRAVTQAAGVSVSAANYHFGSKAALLHATLGRVIVPVNEERLTLLENLEEQAGDSIPSVELVLEAFLRPAVESRDDSDEKRARYRQVVARLFSDPPEIVAAFKQEHFGPILERFSTALERALPDRQPAELAVAFQFVVGMMVHLIAGQMDSTPSRTEPLPLPPNEELLAHMACFAAAGLRAAPGGVS
jgi:AcrR family transcriptional regulator